MIDEKYVQMAKKKAKQSDCRYKIRALAFNKKGDLIYKTTNVHRLSKKGGGIHAEMRAMAKYGELIKTLIICRVNNSGHILPIDPCIACARKAEELGIKIKTISNEN